MSTLNPFDLLEDVESDDPSLLIAATEKKIAAKKAAAPAAAAPTSAAKLPTKPLPPAQAVKEARNNSAPARGGRGGAGRGGGRGGRGYGDRDRSYRDYSNTNGYARGPDNAAAENGTVASGTDEGERGPRGPRGPYRGGSRRGGYGNGEEGEEGRPRRTYDRHSGTGRGFGMKKDGAGRANWGTSTDENPADKETEENVNAEEKLAEKEPGQDDVPASDEAAKDKEGDAEAEKEEDKEMTLEEYEKVLEEKRKALLALKAEERKVELDKELQSMQVLSLKKNNDDIFIKLGTDKESKKKESAEEKAKKSVSINDFLKPAEGESFYGRGRGGRGGRGRGGFRGDGGRNRGPVAAPSIADQNQFPSLGGK